MAAARALLALTALLASCTTEWGDPPPIQVTLSSTSLTIAEATYKQAPPFATLSVKNDLGSTIYISPARPQGTMADLLVVNFPAYTQVAPGQTRVVNVSLDNRPWRWKSGTYTASFPFEIRYFFSGQDADEAENPPTNRAPESVFEIMTVDVAFSIDCDLDGDGQDSFKCGGTDCDDGRAGVFEGADETCNGLDDDCDGAIDNDATDARAWYLDEDGDTFGAIGSRVDRCTRPGEDWATRGQDCDDEVSEVNPDAPELCVNGFDDDCDDEIDAADADCD